MCRGSQAVTTFEWYRSQPKPVSADNHEYVNWEEFDAWNSKRRVNMSDFDTFKDRPEPQPWELLDRDVRLGIKKPEPEQNEEGHD
jgi:hypothetical protein